MIYVTKFSAAFGLAFLATAMTNCLAAEVQRDPAPIYWKQAVFSIPYQINRPATADDAPLEVRLLVSQDAGATWRKLQSAEPHVKGFIYNAENEDGDYWFAVQTVDRFGRQHPAGDVRPELHVVVDTAPPKLDLESTVNLHGEVVIRCRQQDANLHGQGLAITVRPENGPPQSMEIPEGAADGTEGLLHEMTYTPPLGTRMIHVRAETSDLAGNGGMAQIEVDLVSARERQVASRPAAGAAAVAVSQQNAAAGRSTPAGRADVWNPVSGAPYPQTNFGPFGVPQGHSLDPPQLAGATAGGPSDLAPRAWPVDKAALAPPQTQTAASPNTAPAEPNAPPDTPSSQVADFETLPPPKAAEQQSWAARQTSMPLTSSPIPNATAAASVPLQPMGAKDDRGGAAGVDLAAATPPEEIGPGALVQPHVDGSVGAAAYPSTGAPAIDAGWGGEAAGPVATPLSAAQTPGDGWQMVNSRTIAIDYEVASAGPWGVSAVELWGTRDAGRSWRRYTVDDDNRSPVTATVEGEGDYGFRVVVHSAGGFAAAPPQRGDAPEALVRVDLVRPEATIQSVEQGTGNAADQILIRWSAADRQLAPQPVTLYYSAQPAGPWSIVAAGLANTGSYSWRADRHLPEQLYIRLEVRDAAGNVTTFQTAQPVAVQRPRPQVRIREIRSFDSAPSQAIGE